MDFHMNLLNLNTYGWFSYEGDFQIICATRRGLILKRYSYPEVGQLFAGEGESTDNAKSSK